MDAAASSSGLAPADAGPFRTCDRGHTTSLRRADGDLDHAYGDRVSIVARPSLVALLTRYSDREIKRPEARRLVRLMYEQLGMVVVDRVLDHHSLHAMQVVETPMLSYIGPKAHLQTCAVNPNDRVVVAELARAGIIPSETIMDVLGNFLNDDAYRLDTFSSERQPNGKGGVSAESEIVGPKIGGTCEDATLVIADVVGATGSTLRRLRAVYADYARARSEGTFKRIICVHCVVSADYLRVVRDEFPDVEVITIRVDRVFSADDVLSTRPGERHDEECGLLPNGYIGQGVGDAGRKVCGGNI